MVFCLELCSLGRGPYTSFDKRSFLVSALTFTSGQRIPPRTALPVPNLPQTNGPAAIPSPPSRYSLFDLARVEAWAGQHGLTDHHLKMLYNAVFDRIRRGPTTRILSFDEDLTASLKQSLHQHCFPIRLIPDLLLQFTISTVSLVETHCDVENLDTGHIKLVLRILTHPGQPLVETVLIPHHQNIPTAAATTSPDDSSSSSSHLPLFARKTRYTVCVSSQVGCARACSFCATGTMGLHAQLTSADILEQVFVAQQVIHCLYNNNNNRNDRISTTQDDIKMSTSNSTPQSYSVVRNVVFMGMGEPLDNWPAVHEACRGLTHQRLFGLAESRITISTVGASPRSIRTLADEAPSIRLAISLHGATKELREFLLPATKGPGSSLKELEAALDYHKKKTGRGAMIEYLVIQDVNDTDEAALALIDFCNRRYRPLEDMEPTAISSNYVNVIPYNPTTAGNSFSFSTPTDDAIHSFVSRLKTAGVPTRVRWSSTRGRDANAACGQLALLT